MRKFALAIMATFALVFVTAISVLADSTGPGV